MANLAYSRLGGSSATFQQMIQRFGVVTVMNARVYETSVTLGSGAENVETIVKKVLQLDSNGNVEDKTGVAPLCRLDTLKIANATQEGPTKTVSGGQYSNPLIKFGKSEFLFIIPAPFSHLFPDMYLLPSLNLLIVSKQ